MPAIYRSSSSVSILRTAKTIFLNQGEHFTRALRPPLSAICRSGSPHVRLRSAGDHRVLPSAQGKRALSSRAGPKPHNEPTRTPERHTPLSLSYKSPLGNSRRASQLPALHSRLATPFSYLANSQCISQPPALHSQCYAHCLGAQQSGANPVQV